MYHCIVLLFSIIFQTYIELAVSSNDTCICGQEMSDEALAHRVVGGGLMGDKDHPYLALLLYRQLYNCGGSIVSPQFVLTAAHCVASKLITVDTLSLAVGVHDRMVLESESGSHSRLYQIHEVIVHNHYKSAENKIVVNDIALLKVVGKIEFNNYIQPICLPFYTNERDYQSALVVGWGLTATHGYSSRYPRQAVLSLVSNQQCMHSPIGEALSAVKNVYNVLLCAYRVNMDACRGDSGGPLLVRSAQGILIQIGIVSFGEEECGNTSGSPGMYSRVSSYLDWLQFHLNAEMCFPPIK